MKTSYQLHYKLSDLLHLPWLSDNLGCLLGTKKRNIRQGITFLAFEGIKRQKCFQLASLCVSFDGFIFFALLHRSYWGQLLQ